MKFKENLPSLYDFWKAIIIGMFVAFNLNLYFTSKLANMKQPLVYVLIVGLIGAIIGIMIILIEFFIFFLIKKDLKKHYQIILSSFMSFALTFIVLKLFNYAETNVNILLSFIPCIYSIVFLYLEEKEIKKLNYKLEKTKDLYKNKQ